MTAHAGTDPLPAPAAQGLPISLVLGSGAARGLAHIGVIRVLEAAGYEIRAIAGSSMGALIGGIYAAGRLADYESWVRELREIDVLRLLDISFTGQAGVLRGDLVIDTLRKLLGEHRIEDLPMPFTAVATDIEARREVWLDRGSLFDAIRASIAIPGVFTPKRIGERLLVDGGLLDPVPIAPTLRNTTALTVAVAITGTPVRRPLGRAEPPQAAADEGPHDRVETFISNLQQRLGLHNRKSEPDNQQLSLADVVLQSLELIQDSVARFKLAAHPPDVLIEIPTNVCRAHEFYRAAEVIPAGEHWAWHALERLPAGLKP